MSNSGSPDRPNGANGSPSLPVSPPRLAVRMLSWALPREERESVLGDLEETMASRAKPSGSSDAVWYWTQALLMCLAFGGHRVRRTFSHPKPETTAKSRPAPWDTASPPRSPTPKRGSPMQGWLPDLRSAFRSFVKQPGFTLSAVAIIALGIGATTTIFSVVDTVLLRPLPYPGSDRIVFFDNRPHTFPNFTEWREHLSSFDAIGALTNTEGSLSGRGSPVHVMIAQATLDLLPMLGARAGLGRLFVEGDQREGSPVVVLSHAFWEQQWGSDPEVVGHQIRLDGNPVIVAGVLDADFVPPEALTARSYVDVWRLVDETDPANRSRSFRTFGVVARLREGVSVATAQAEIDALTASLARELPEAFVYADGTLAAFPLVLLQEATVRRVSATLLMLLGAVALMLLIACANVANLFLARGTARSAEIALRGALGASNGRIVRQLLTESGGLGLVGGAGGIGLAFLGVDLFTRLGPGHIPRLAGVAVDLRVLSFALALSVATGVLCGLYPAMQAARRSVTAGLREATGKTTSGRQRRNLRSILLVTELALTVVLLTGAGLLFRSMMVRLSLSPGFRTDGLVVVPLELGDNYSRQDRVRFARDLRDRIGEIPGVQAVAAGWTLPFVFPPRVCCWTGAVRTEGAATGENVPTTWIRPITQDYFTALGVPLRRGREFTAEDVDSDASVAIINTRLARRLFGTEEAVDRTLMIGDGGSIRVVGVVPDLHHGGLEEEVGETLYLPYTPDNAGLGILHVAVRSDVPLGPLVPALGEAISALDPDLAPQEIVPMQQLVANSLATPRFLAILLGAFASLALILACSGIYASMSYAVGQRKKEMGIRMALGAKASQVSRMILWDGALITLLGLGIGTAGALALSRVLRSLVWGVSTADGPTYAVVCLLLTMAALGACLIPARRAARANPVQSLREE